MTQFSHSFFTLLLMLRPVLALTSIAAISNKFTIGVTFLQFDVIDLCDAAGCATHHRVGHPSVCATHFNIDIDIAAILCREIK
jgi:hypothetical protein